MKHLLWGAFAAAAIACGGGSKPPTTPEPKADEKTPCSIAAKHSAGVLAAAVGPDMTAERQAGLVRVFTERCQADAWSDDAVACLSSAGAADELERCGEMLTEEQQEATTMQLEREKLLPSAGDGEEGESSDEAPKKMAPPAPPPPDDPCGGGA